MTYKIYKVYVNEDEVILKEGAIVLKGKIVEVRNFVVRASDCLEDSPQLLVCVKLLENGVYKWISADSITVADNKEV